MGVREFIVSFRKAFGEKPYLPIVIWYSKDPESSTPKTGGCIFKHLRQLLQGYSVSFTADHIGRV